MMPGGSPEAYKYIKDIVTKVSAQVRAYAAHHTGTVCTFRTVRTLPRIESHHPRTLPTLCMLQHDAF